MFFWRFAILLLASVQAGQVGAERVYTVVDLKLVEP